MVELFDREMISTQSSAGQGDVAGDKTELDGVKSDSEGFNCRLRHRANEMRVSKAGTNNVRNINHG